MSSSKYYLSYITFILAIGGLTFTSCRKENGIDNNKVIRTPYGVYFSNVLGDLQNTNDGVAFKHLYPGDGTPPRAIATSGDHSVLWIKKDLFRSDNDKNFNVMNGSVSTSARWQSMILDVPSMDVVLLASNNSFGVQVSPDNGITWSDDVTKPGSPAPTKIQSFTQTADGKVYGLENSTGFLYRRVANSGWDTIITTTALPSGNFYLSHINNTLLAADYNGASGVYYSNDGGWNWSPYSGIPGNQQILSIDGSLDQVVLAGSDSAGIYRLEGTVFKPSNNGLKAFTSVYGIVGKQDTYKNQVIKQYVYIATSTGLYRSEDLGQNWVRMYTDDIRAVH